MAQIITLQEAQELTFAYQDSSMSVNQTIATSVDKTSILNLLNQPNCEGMRMYFGLDDNNKLTLVIVGTNVQGNDMTSGQILDRMNICPFDCDNNSSLIQP
jgi:DNA-directed RNA polymerase sigma subunit (sigma70/sigma32)